MGLSRKKINSEFSVKTMKWAMKRICSSSRPKNYFYCRGDIAFRSIQLQSAVLFSLRASTIASSKLLRLSMLISIIPKLIS